MSGSIILPRVGGSGGGGIASINGSTASAQTIVAGPGIDVSSALGQTTISLDGSTAGYNPESFLFTDSSGGIITKAGWNYFTDTNGMNVNLDEVPDDTGGRQIHNLSITVLPTIDSPSTQYNQLYMETNIDPNSSGFELGTGGNFLNLQNLYVNHKGTSDTGSLVVSTAYMDLGNGTDPIDIQGYSGHFLFGDINSGVNLSRGFQGYIFQPHVHVGATFSSGGAYSTIFADFANVEVSCDGWTSYNASPRFSGVHDNSNYAGLNISPEIGTMEGNSNATWLNMGGSITTQGTSGTTFLNFNSAITTLSQSSRAMFIGGQVASGTAEWIGLDITTQQINTTGPLIGMRLSATNNPDATALEVQGHLTSQCNLTLASGLGQTYNNIVGGSITVPNGTAITGTDVIGNNMAISIATGDAGSSWTAASIVGLTTLGFVGVISGDGAVNGPINFCLGGFAQTANGTIDRINNFSALAVPSGGTAVIAEHVLFFADMPAGTIATTTWGIRVDNETIENHLERLAINTASKTVTNASCGVEIGGTTKALRLSNLTTTQRLALTPLAGMQVFDTTLTQMAYYNGTTWVLF